MSITRKEQAFTVRLQAALLAKNRPHEEHVSNGDETRYYFPETDEPSLIASFTKGLPHNRDTGLLKHVSAFKKFVKAVETGRPEDIKAVPLGPKTESHSTRYRSGIAKGNNSTGKADSRAWESMAAGNAFDLQGPDPQSLTMPPAPALESEELVTEMTEMYWMSLLRDVRFEEFHEDEGVNDAIKTLNSTKWISDKDNFNHSIHGAQKKRLRGLFNLQTVFRGVTPGDDVGPYISQFLLAGNRGIGDVHEPSDGFIQYGAVRIDQRVRVATPHRDYMTTWEQFIDVQNGADLRGRETYDNDSKYRFITTPRDLATYVHHDALYEAYLNACIFLLAIGAPFDKGIPFTGDDDKDKQQGFALFGGPHILTLVTEVATRALKAVRFQKYNTHRRARPEAIAGLLERFSHENHNPVYAPVKKLYRKLDNNMLQRVAEKNGYQNSNFKDFGHPRSDDYDPSKDNSKNLLLPMAFPEGSPMHPSYGAGHATVAGACVTILKAFFNHKWKLPSAYVPSKDGTTLHQVKLHKNLTLEGELNKLCSNISIGRNWAGVHYYSDYFESIALGEKIAIGLLEEQMLTYKEEFEMSLPKFDGSIYYIRRPSVSVEGYKLVAIE